LLGIGHVTVCGLQKHKIRGEVDISPRSGQRGRGESERRRWKTGSGRGLNSAW